jgi:hypothetical protein
MNNQSALDAFMNRKTEIDALLAKLKTASDNHFDASPEEINWGHVGDLGRIIELLKEADGQ